MKTKITSQLLIILASTSLLVSSCTKDVQTNPNETTTPSVNSQIGLIVDMGIISSNIHQMEATLNFQQNVYDSISGKMLGVGSSVVTDFFVNEDGTIPSGVYNFSSSSTKAPFTFGNTVISLTNNDGTQGSLDVTDGVISVNLSNNQYNLNYTFKLQSGITLNGKAIGKMDYTDSYLTYKK